MSISRRTALGLMTALSLTPLTRAFAQTASPLTGDALATSAGDVILAPVSHASVVLGFGAETIYVDPVGADALAGLPPPTLILITHAHGDHFDEPTLTALGTSAPILTTQEVHDKMTDAFKARAQVIGNGQSTTINGIAIDAVAAYNTTPDRTMYHPMGVGNGYVLTFGDRRVYIAGDTEDTPEMRALTAIDVAFLPMNLPYTMSIEQAADAVAAFKPAAVYPYHYRGSDVDAFAALVAAGGSGAEVQLREFYPAA
jgi:L-ascorbate metabolism protein UlaG (beta-lactamase superfamily)